MTRGMTEEEFKEWLAHPGTRSVLEVLAAKREELRQAWEGGSFTDYESGGTVLVNVGNLGTCKGYAFMQELTYEQYLGELDGEHFRAGAARRSGTD